MRQQSVQIVNEKGLHARAAASFVDMANRYRSRIELRRGSETVDGKSILGILTLAAPRGTELLLSAEGPDEDEAVAALSELVAGRFDDGN